MLTYKQISNIITAHRGRNNGIPEDEIIEKILLRIQKKIKEEEKPVNIPFEDFWDVYDKKVDRPKCEKKWKSLKDAERSDIMLHVPMYKMAQPEKMYRKHPYTYLNNRCWEDEIIMHKPIIVETASKKTIWL